MTEISSAPAAAFSIALSLSVVAQMAYSEVSAATSVSPFGGALRQDLYLCTDHPDLHLPMVRRMLGDAQRFNVITDQMPIDEDGVTLVFLGSPDSAFNGNCITQNEAFSQYASEALSKSSRTVPESQVFPGGDSEKLRPVDAQTIWDNSGETIDWYFGFCYVEVDVCDDSILSYFSDMLKEQ